MYSRLELTGLEGGSTDRCNTLSYGKRWSVLMVYRTRIKYSAEQKTDIWDRWQRGESLNSIGRSYERASGSMFTLLVHILDHREH